VFGFQCSLKMMGHVVVDYSVGCRPSSFHSPWPCYASHRELTAVSKLQVMQSCWTPVSKSIERFCLSEKAPACKTTAFPMETKWLPIGPDVTVHGNAGAL